MARAAEYDAIVLDLMLPGRRRLRASAASCARTASGRRSSCSRPATRSRTASQGSTRAPTTTSTKPFSFAELLARLRALARRGAAERRRCSRSAISGSTRRRGRSGAATPRSRSRQGVRAARDLHAAPGRRALAALAARARLGLRLREPLERRRRLRPLPAREGRPAVRTRLARDGARRRLPARARTAAHERLPIRLAADARRSRVAWRSCWPALGAFLYVRLEPALDERIDEDLEARAQTLTRASCVERRRRRRPRTARSPARTGFAQVIDAAGRRRRSTPTGGDAVLDCSTRRRGSRRGSSRGRRRRAARRGARLLADAGRDAGGDGVLVVGASLDDRDEALAASLTLLLVGAAASRCSSRRSPAMSLAGAALRPVEAMRAGAEAISASTPASACRCPAAHDEIRRLGETLNEMLGRLERGSSASGVSSRTRATSCARRSRILKTELELALRQPRTADELRERRPIGRGGDRPARPARRRPAGRRERRTRRAPLRLAAARRRRAARGRRSRRFAAPRGRRARDRGARRRRRARRSSVDRYASSRRSATSSTTRSGTATGRCALDAERATAGRAARHDEGAASTRRSCRARSSASARDDDARDARRTGLGLAIVEAIARAHGGSAQRDEPRLGGADVWIGVPSSRLNDAGCSWRRIAQ